MRVSIWIGLPVLALGVLLAYFAKELKYASHEVAGIVAVVLFILLSSMALGVGAALVIHWLMNLVAGWFAFVAEMFLSFSLFFIGVGVTAALVGDSWSALHIFLTFLFASTMLFGLAFVSLFGSVWESGKDIGSVLWKRFQKKRKR